MDWATVGTATHGDGEAGPGDQTAPQHEVNTGQDDVGQDCHSQHSDQNKTVYGVDLHTVDLQNFPNCSNSIYIWKQSC